MNTLFYVKKDTICKNLIISFFLTNFLVSVSLNLNILNILKLNKDLFLKSISLTELVANQKIFIISKKIILHNRIKQNSFNLYLKVVLRKTLMFNFLSYLNCFLFSEMRNSYSYFNYNSNLYFYTFKINNIMNIRVLKSNFLMWFLPIFVTFNFSNVGLLPLVYNNLSK